MDKYQERYLEHQKCKKGQLLKLLEKRHSDRIFTDKEIDGETLSKITENANFAPSSCNRRGVTIKIVSYRENKELLGGILVGGVGWIHRADRVFLLLGHGECYKEGLPYMPYLDAGFLAYNVWLSCTELGIGCCYINPNVREQFQYILEKEFLDNNEIFCGALAVGYIK